MFKSFKTIKLQFFELHITLNETEMVQENGKTIFDFIYNTFILTSEINYFWDV